MNSLIRRIKSKKIKIHNNEPEIETPKIEKPEIDYIVIEKTINSIKKNKVEIEKPFVIISYDPNDTTLYL